MVQDLLAVQAGQASRKHTTAVKSVTIPARRFKRWAKLIRIRVSQTLQKIHTSSDQNKMPQTKYMSQSMLFTLQKKWRHDCERKA
jgi:hypothetical protein